jgi:predicted hotdog family 3-hydroxylacyl-ACP dehydratase
VAARREQYPPVTELLPHAGRWVLLSSVLEHEPDVTTCLITVGEAFPFRFEQGRVPALLGLEYMAQCIAVHGALRARSEDEPAPVGLLLGASDVELPTDGFRPGQCLEVTVRRMWGEGTFFIFECSVRDQASRKLLMNGNLKVFRAREPEAAQ